MEPISEAIELGDLSLEQVFEELKTSFKLLEDIDKATGNQEKLKERCEQKVPPLEDELATLLTERALHEVRQKGERYPKVKRIEKVRLRLGKLATEIKGAQTALEGLKKMRVEVEEERQQLIERRDFLVQEKETQESATLLRERIFGRTFKFHVEPQGDWGPGSYEISIEVDKGGKVTGLAKPKSPQPPGEYKIQGKISSAGEVDLHCTAEHAIPGQSVGDYWVKGSISETGHVDLHCQAHYDWTPPGNLKVHGRCREDEPLVVYSGIGTGGPVNFKVFPK